MCFLKVRDVFLAPSGGDADPNVAVHLDSVVLLEQLPPGPFAPVPVLRRVCIGKTVELARWGHTAGCRGCIAVQTGSSPDQSEE